VGLGAASDRSCIAISGAMQEINGTIHEFPVERANDTTAFAHESNSNQEKTPSKSARVG
jgi:hypothetical protein